MTIALGLAGWFVGSVFAALLFGRAISATDRDCDSEESANQPVSERPSKILVISKHGGLRK